MKENLLLKITVITYSLQYFHIQKFKLIIIVWEDYDVKKSYYNLINTTTHFTILIFKRDP